LASLFYILAEPNGTVMCGTMRYDEQPCNDNFQP